jgi:hypothetical protein
MKRNLAIVFIALAMLGATFFISGCEFFKDGDVRVTINLVRNDLAFMNQKPAEKLHIVDRILRFFSNPAYGAFGWSSEHTGPLSLRITGEGVNESIIIPSGATSYSTTVPSSVAIKFTITHEYTVGSFDNWGGIHEGVFISGTDAQITITMLPIVSFTTVGSVTSPNIYYDSLPSGYESVVTGCRLYRSQTSNGSSTLVASQGYVDMIQTTPFIADSTGFSGISSPVYYKIVVYGPGGEGVPSEERIYSF